MRPAARRLGSRQGMTLIETLLSLLLVTLLSAVTLTGGQAALRVYTQSTFAADAQTVSDTVNTALADVLRYAEQVQQSGDFVTAYTSSAYGIQNGTVTIETASEHTGVLYLDKEKQVPLLSDLAYAGLWVVPEDFSKEAPAADAEFSLRFTQGAFWGQYRLYDPAKGLLSDPFTFSCRALGAA